MELSYAKAGAIGAALIVVAALGAWLLRPDRTPPATATTAVNTPAAMPSATTTTAAPAEPTVEAPAPEPTAPKLTGPKFSAAAEKQLLSVTYALKTAEGQTMLGLALTDRLIVFPHFQTQDLSRVELTVEGQAKLSDNSTTPILRRVEGQLEPVADDGNFTFVNLSVKTMQELAKVWGLRTPQAVVGVDLPMLLSQNDTAYGLQFSVMGRAVLLATSEAFSTDHNIVKLSEPVADLANGSALVTADGHLLGMYVHDASGARVYASTALRPSVELVLQAEKSRRRDEQMAQRIANPSRGAQPARRTINTLTLAGDFVIIYEDATRTLQSFDAQQMQPIGKRQLQGKASSLCAGPDGHSIYVAQTGPNELIELALPGLEPRRSCPIAGPPLKVQPIGADRAVYTTENPDEARLVSMTRSEPERTLLRATNAACALDAAKHLLYVVSGGGMGTVLNVLDVSGEAPIATKRIRTKRRGPYRGQLELSADNRMLAFGRIIWMTDQLESPPLLLPESARGVSAVVDSSGLVMADGQLFNVTTMKPVASVSSWRLTGPCAFDATARSLYIWDHSGQKLKSFEFNWQ